MKTKEIKRENIGTGQENNVIYRKWYNLPANLKTKTMLRKEGKQRRRNQPVIAYIKTRRGKYALYDVNEAIPKRKLSVKQKKAFQEMLIRTTCRECKMRWKQNRISKYGLCPPCQDEYDYNKSRKLKVINELKRITETPFVVLDLETTGLNSTYDGIVEIGIIDGQTGDMLLSTLINPGTRIYNSNIHGITDEMVKNSPGISDKVKVIKKILKGKNVAIYNAQFDSGFLKSAGINIKKDRYICLMELTAEYFGQRYGQGYKWVSLREACKYFNIRNEHGHRSIADCQSARELLYAIMDSEKEYLLQDDG